MEFMSIPSIKYDKKANLKKRLSNRDFAEKISKGVLDYYEVVDEAIGFSMGNSLKHWMLRI